MSGTTDRERTRRLGRSIVERMNAALQHRGPDDSGIVEVPVRSESEGSDCHLFLGNTRLAILDTSTAGHQPMFDSQTANWITYNGETYNYRLLRQEIDDDYGAWQSNTDTEVVLRGYQKWGVDALNRLRGMFALAIWDGKAQQLLLARDRFGIKPLYYASIAEHDAKHFVFASELKALLATGIVPFKLSGPGLSSFLNFGSVQAPLTILNDVKMLDAGECLRVSASASTFSITSSSLSAKASTIPVPENRSQAVEQMRGELEASVAAHLVADVPLGVFLSGGMDSSALVALMSRISTQRPRTFSVVFEEEKFTESAHAQFVAQKFQTEHTEIPLTEDELLQRLPRAIASLDQPSIDGINTYVISKAVKNAGVTVALSGLGGDELFAGYPSFKRAVQSRALPAAAKTLLRATVGVGRIALRDSVRGQKFVELVAGGMTPDEIYRVSRQLFRSNEIDSLALPELRGSSNGQNCSSAAFNGESQCTDWINAISKLELSGYMSNTLLRDTDSMSMASSLEVRVPFVDVNVVDFAQSLPGDWKIDASRSQLPKPLLADAISDLLPASFLSRPKMGFTLPFERWMQSQLRLEIDIVIKDRTRLECAGLVPKTVSDFWQRFLAAPRTVGWSRPWSLYVLAKWCELNSAHA